MTRDDTFDSSELRDKEEAASLLSSSLERANSSLGSGIERTARHNAAPRQSSLSLPLANGQPRASRTQNRVRFNIDDQQLAATSVHAPSPPLTWIRDDSDDSDEEDDVYRRNSSGSLRAPLLTGIEAPSVTVATSGDFNPEDHLENARPRSGMRSAFMNMANSIIGAGIIGQPYAFRQAGLTMGIVLLVTLTITVDWTIRLIIVNSKLSGADSFQATMEYCFGRSGLVAISIAQWAFAFGGMIAFCIIVGDTIPHVVTALFPNMVDMPFFWLFTNRRAIIIIFVFGVSYPLSLYRDIAKLAKASTFALLSMFIIIITVITQGMQVPPELKGDLKGDLFLNKGFLQAVGVISFAFVCHHNSLLIYGSLKKPTLDRFAKVTHYSTGISMIACMAMALAGFLTFGNKTLGNVLNNFPTNNVMVNIARFFFGLNMLTTLPLECFVCREVMTNYWFPDEPWQPNRHLIFTTSLVFTTVALALITCDLGSVFELIGATSACALAYILPPLCYVKLSTRSWKTIPAVICIIFGTAVMTISLVQAAAKMIRNEGGTATC